MNSLVIARYHESLDWILKYEEGFNIHIYDKSDETNGYEKLPNVGREQSTFDYHCWKHWHHLDDVTFFLQGSVDAHEINLDVETDWFKSLGIQRPHPGDDGSIRRDSGLWPQCVSVEGCKIICEIIGKPYTDNVSYGAGGMFAATRECLQQYTPEVYKRLYDLAFEDPRYAWNMERLRTKMFER